MKLTIDNEDVERALRERAAAENKAVDRVIIEALARELGVELPPVKRRDLSDIAGQGLITPEIKAALADQRRIDRELWQ